MITALIFPLILLFIITFILLLILMNKSSAFSFVKFYFTIVAIVSIIGMAIAFGIAIYQQGMQVLISDQEYLVGNSRWEIEQCEQGTWKTVPGNPDGQQIEKTPKEIESCKAKNTAKVINQRSYNTKESTIWGITRGIIFLILFLTHYPRMIAEEKEPKRTPTPRNPTTRARRIAKK